MEISIHSFLLLLKSLVITDNEKITRNLMQHTSGTIKFDSSHSGNCPVKPGTCFLCTIYSKPALSSNF